MMKILTPGLHKPPDQSTPRLHFTTMESTFRNNPESRRSAFAQISNDHCHVYPMLEKHVLGQLVPRVVFVTNLGHSNTP